MNKLNDAIIEVARLKNALNKLINEKQNLLDPDVIKVSKMLDIELNKLYNTEENS